MMDLVVLVADKNMEYTLRSGLRRHESLGIREISFETLQHVDRDGGVRSTGPEIIRIKRRLFSHALLVLDHEGSGATETAEQLERRLDRRLSEAWGTAAKAIVIVPELETWIWGSDNALKQALDWPLRPDIRRWIAARGYGLSDDGKPDRPKEAFEEVLRECRIPRSSALYGKITERISIRNCIDPALGRLREQLHEWFPLP